MNKRWLYGTSGLAFVLIVGGIVAAGARPANASSVSGNMESDLHSATQMTGDYEQINSTSISKKDVYTSFAFQKVNATFHSQPVPSVQSMLNYFNGQQVQYLEAVKEGYGVSMATAQQYAQQQEQQFNSDTSDTFGHQLLSDYEQGLGINAQQYWNSVAPKGYQMALSISNMKKAHYVDWAKANPKGTLLQWNQFWGNYVNTLLSQANISQASNN